MKNKPWFWTVLLVITSIICLSALVLHYQNWIDEDTSHIRIRSGFYTVKVNFNDLDSVVLVPKIPPMQRLNGFSALQKEKGIFREFQDSLTTNKVYVFVDNIEQQKIKLVYKDSLKVYVNKKDSLATDALFNFLKNHQSIK